LIAALALLLLGTNLDRMSSLGGVFGVALAQGHEHSHDHDHDHQHDHDHADEHDHDHHHDHSHAHAAVDGTAGVRLLLGVANEPRVVVVSAVDGRELASFGTPAAGTVQQLADTQFAAVVHGAANRVTFLHSGLTAVDHGDHADLVEGQPYVLATVNTGQRPAHLASYGDDVVIFNDGDGSVAWFDARLFGASINYDQVQGPAPDHGAAVPFAGHVAVGLITPGTMHVFDRGGVQRATFEGCERLHGQGLLHDRAVFGCVNGVLVVRQGAGGVFQARLLPNPAGSPEGARVGTLVTRGATDFLVGNFGEGFAVIDPVALTLNTYEAPGTQVGGVFFAGGTSFARLGSDGYVRTYDAAGTELGAVSVTNPVQSGGTNPAITALGDLAFVTDPAQRQVMLVDLSTATVVGHLHLDVVPAGVALLAIPGAVLH